ncbi:MAG: hypothetical protein D3916_01065 [Candidatus Electrothrix sp. MAN1_4]|nr:hypothetical protein [Candidatus Electrothrix sp. MAN1_4]
MKLYISPISIKILLLGMGSAYILSGCTTGRQFVPPYREVTIPSEPERILPSKPPQQIQPPQTPSQSPQVQQQATQRSTKQKFYKNTNKEKLLRPINATVGSRVAFYTQKTKSWQELEQNKYRYRTPEQSRKVIACQSKVAALHDAYKDLQIQLFNNRNTGTSHEEIIVTLQHLQNKDFSYLEGECPTLFKQLSTSSPRFTPERFTSESVTAPNELSRELGILNTPSENNFLVPDQNNKNNLSTPTPEQNPDQYKQAIQSEPTGQLTPPEPAPNYEERYQYAQSLLKQGREEEARRILSDLLASVRQTGNRALQIKILKNRAELEFALRNYLPARILYEELKQLNAPFDRQHLLALQAADSHREEVDAYAALLLSAITSDPAQDGFTVPQQGRAFLHNFPTSPLRPHVKKLVAKTEQEAEQWFQQLIQKSDEFVVNQQRNDALTLLEKVPLDILPLDKQEIIRQKKETLTAPLPAQDLDPMGAPTSDSTINVNERSNVRLPEQVQENTETLKQEHSVSQTIPQKITDEASEQKKQASSIQRQPTETTALHKKWNRAEEALQATEYDKAIALFSDLRNTSLHTQALKKMKKASQTAGQEARRKAAHFFQRANSATEPKIKKQHLLSSKTILEEILQKYPLAGLDAKVKRNLNRVDKELTALDHMPFQ